MEALRVTTTSVQVAVAVAAIVIIALLAIIWRRVKSSAKRQNHLKSYLIPNPPKDTVILHQYGKAITVPSISPFVMKLETYLRVANIPYENKYSRKPGPKGKLPWIQYNDKVVPDSQFCIEFLNTERQVDLNKRLRPDQVALGHVLRRTVEESLYWTLLMWRLVLDANGTVYRKLGLPSLIIWYMRRSSKPRLWSQGIGRHTQEEVTHLMDDDLKAVSVLLGEKKFLFGNTEADVTEFDCAVFGQLCQLVWQMPGTPVGEMIAEKYPNLVKYCERMKLAFWPDWDSRLVHPSEKSELEASSTQQIQPSKETSVDGTSVATEVKSHNYNVSKNTHEQNRNQNTPSPTAMIIPASSMGKETVVKTVNGVTKSVTTTTSSSTSSSFMREVHKEVTQNQALTSRSTKVTASSILQDKSAILPAP